jgi:predicted ATP-grasp superfamily ATP-dependent carboligase
MALWVAQLPDGLGARFPSSNSTTETLQVLQDKREFAQLCKRLGVPHPRCYDVTCDADLNLVPFGEVERLFFKPTNSVQFLERFNVKGIWIRRRDDAESLWHDIAPSGLHVLVQEYIPGGADQHFFLDGFRDRDGRIRTLFARQRSRIYPPDFGNSSYCVNVPLEVVQPAWESLYRILEQTNYRGIFSAEYKRDARDGQFKILEINTRVWVYVEFAARCGADVCQLAYQDALGEPMRDMPIQRHGDGCVNVYFDYYSVKKLPPSQRPNLFRLLWQWMASHKTVLAIDDPLPLASWFASALRKRLRRAIGQR